MRKLLPLTHDLVVVHNLGLANHIYYNNIKVWRQQLASTLSCLHGIRWRFSDEF